jgi:hypothetical protein
MALAVAVTLAIPEALVTAVLLDRVALAPLAGAVKATITPFTGFPHESFTVACNAFGKAVPARVDCGVPPVAAILAGCPAAFVRENDVESVGMLAVMV